MLRATLQRGRTAGRGRRAAGSLAIAAGSLAIAAGSPAIAAGSPVMAAGRVGGAMPEYTRKQILGSLGLGTPLIAFHCSEGCLEKASELSL